jgi:regulator of protease activity HflC (stomatin/prohibitin superfamily)
MRFRVWTLILLVTVLAGCDILETGQQVIVRDNEIGVLSDAATGEMQTLQPGTHIYDPFNQNVTFYPTFVQHYMFSGSNTGMDTVTASPAVEAQTLDGTAVTISLSVVFRINPENVILVHQNWYGTAGDFRVGYIRPATRMLVQSVVSTVDLQTLTTLLPAELADRFTVPLRDDMAANGFILERIDVLRVDVVSK